MWAFARVCSVEPVVQGNFEEQARGLHSGASNLQIAAARAVFRAVCRWHRAVVLRNSENRAVVGMARPFWLRPLRLAEKPAESVPRAAVRGEPFDLLLRSAATRLQEAMNADRAGCGRRKRWVSRHGRGIWRKSRRSGRSQNAPV